MSIGKASVSVSVLHLFPNNIYDLDIVYISNNSDIQIIAIIDVYDILIVVINLYDMLSILSVMCTIC